MIIYLCISTSTSIISTSTSNRVYLDYQIQLGNLRMSSEATTASNTAASSTTSGYSSSTSPPAALSPDDRERVVVTAIAREYRMSGNVISLDGGKIASSNSYAFKIHTGLVQQRLGVVLGDDMFLIGSQCFAQSRLQRVLVKRCC
jgi:hypothetical protein